MKKIVSIILCICLIFTFASCGNNVKKDDGTINIVASFYPILLITKAVVGDIPGIEVTNLTSPSTGCLHDYTLMSDDVKALQNADVFVTNGLNMENFMDKVTNQLPKLDIVTLSEGITPYQNNPHIWVNPENTEKMVENLAEHLSQKYPDKASEFKKNAESYIEKLMSLDKEIKSGVKEFKKHDVVVFHEAFAYFAECYGINIVATIEHEPGEEPTTGEIKDTIKTVKESGVNVLLTEPQYSAKSAEIIASETGAKVYQIDPVVTGKNSDNPDIYITKMEDNLQVMLTALR